MDGSPAVADSLTLIITTSPCRGGCAVHQQLFLALFQSFGQVAGLRGCRVIVVCDGFKLVKAEGSKVKLKNGIVTAGIADGYGSFMCWLSDQINISAGWLAAYAVEMLALPEWRCWSSAVEHALRQVATDFVMVVQDDRVFVPRWNELGQLLAGMAARPVANGEAQAAEELGAGAELSAESTVGYVLLPTRKFRTHEKTMCSIAGQRKIKLTPDELLLPGTGEGETVFTPCLQQPVIDLTGGMARCDLPSRRAHRLH
jgi:hypothetical protein